MLGADKLCQALQMMNITTFDFYHLYIGVPSNKIEKMYSDLYYNVYKLNFGYVEMLIDEHRLPVLKAAMKCLLIDFDRRIPLLPSERNALVDFLFEINHWSFSDLVILHCSIAQLNSSQITKILEQLHEELEDQRSFKSYRTFISEITLKGSFALIFYGDKLNSRHWINKMQSYTYDEDFYQRNIIHFLKGYHTKKFGNPKEGKTQIVSALQVFKLLGGDIIYNYYAELYKRFIK